MFRLRNLFLLPQICGRIITPNLVNVNSFIFFHFNHFKPKFPFQTQRIKWYTTTTIDNELIEKVLQKNEKLSSFGRDSVERAHNVLLRAGFTSDRSISIIDSYPNVVCLSPKHLENRLEMWHLCQFSKTQFYELFVQCPELLELNDENYIAKRFSELHCIVHTPKNVWRLLMASPNVMFDDWKSIEKKIDYILNEMHADVTDLVKSGSLALPLQKIKTRHTLLVRLGVYKKRNMKASELDQNKNPRLFRIMDSEDPEFALKTCGLSMKELEAFYDLYERELDELQKEQIDYEELSDLESDDELDDNEHDFDPRETEDYYDDRDRRQYYKKRRAKPNVE